MRRTAWPTRFQGRRWCLAQKCLEPPAARLRCRLLYGSDMRLLECLGMRVKDLDFQRHEITVRDGKGRKDRVTLLPATTTSALNDHLERVRRLHEQDLLNGLGRAALPDALKRKYPNADRHSIATALIRDANTEPER